jgi:LytS/YehU family sensor histidine kinase
MMLLNLVENAVKHGEITQQHPLAVNVKLHDGRLIAEVRNHGKLGPEPQGRKGGFAMACARLHAVYGPNASLAIRQDGEDVSAKLELPAAAPAREERSA